MTLRWTFLPIDLKNFKISRVRFSNKILTYVDDFILILAT